MDKYKNLELLDNKAEKLLERQINSFRSLNIKANSLIAINSILVPIFLFLIENTNYIISFLSIIPFIFFFYSLILMVKVIKYVKIFQGFNEKQFDKLVNMEYTNILLYSIGAKKDSISDNNNIIDKKNKMFNKGLKCTIIGVISSFIIIFIKIVVHF